METGKRVSVAVRVRPILRDGISHAHAQEKFELEAVHRVGDTSLKVELQRQGELTRSSVFTFDHIFDQDSSQLEVYEDAVVDLVDAALSGANATILAYGQTGSGKTFTVLGDVKPNPLENDLLTHDSGLFLRVLSDLIDYKMRQAKKGFHVVIGLSCVEIYNESIRDLFGGAPGTPPPPLKAVMIGEEVLLPSLIIKEMTSLGAVFKEIQLAISRRRSRSTESNSTSSRSHCLFFIDILQQADTAPPPSLLILGTKKGAGEKEIRQRILSDGSRPGEMPFDGMVYRISDQKEPIYGSKILLADLAGSEKIGKSGVSGEGLAEATFINSSLTALGSVVHSLHEGTYVSYRTSNLTRLLRTTFSHPDSRVLLLSQVSPTQLTFDETLSTLHFANKVKAMKVTTTMGAETEKLNFDYIETHKVYDALLADLHIFETETESRSAVIRRGSKPNVGLYYSATIKPKTSPGVEDRRLMVENRAALRFAMEERDVLVKEKQRREATKEDEIARKVQGESEKLFLEHMNLMTEAKEAVAYERELTNRLHVQELQLASAGKVSALQTREATAFFALLERFTEEQIVLRKRQIEACEHKQEMISQELNVARLSTSESLEVADDNLKYAQTCRAHCMAKKMFASLMELWEIQVQYIFLLLGCLRLENWENKNKEALGQVRNGVTKAP